MKSYNYLLLTVISVLFLSGCSSEDPFGHTQKQYIQYLFAINIKDAAGNDLVAQFNDNNLSDYSLVCTLSNPVKGEEGSNATTDTYSSQYQVQHLGTDNWYLLNECMYLRSQGGLQESITYRLTFPGIFGDNLEHDIVTFWGDDPILSSANTYADLMPECTKVLFNGKELELKKIARPSTAREGDYYIYLVDIVLDK